MIFLQHFVLQSSADPMADMADAEQTLAATQPEAAGDAVSKDAAASKQEAAQADGQPEGATAVCAKCKGTGAVAEMVHRPQYKDGLQYTCNPCNALTAQLRRNGLFIGQLLKTEEDMIQFYSDAALERKNCEQGRLAFQRSRALLKKHMVHELQRREVDGQESEWQPLSVYELRGYDIEAIRASAPKEDHPILGETFKLQIHKESVENITLQVERQLAEMEHAALERKKSAAAASAAALPELDLDTITDAPERKRKGPMTQEEKDANKLARVAAKKQEDDRKLATASAAKLLPQLKKVQSNLKDKIGSMGDAMQQLPAISLEQVQQAEANLNDVVTKASQLLDSAAKGKPVAVADLAWKKEKELAQYARDGNLAIRVIQDFKRGSAPAKAPGKGKGRGKGGKASRLGGA